jgi:hypothetical protein
MKIRQYDPSRRVAGKAEHTKGSYGVRVFVGGGSHIDRCKSDDDNKFTVPSVLSVLLLVFN